jgi:hypothetical protein
MPLAAIQTLIAAAESLMLEIKKSTAENDHAYVNCKQMINIAVLKLVHN